MSANSQLVSGCEIVELVGRVGVARCSKARDKVVLEKMLERYVSGTDNALAEWLLGRTSAEAIIEIELSWLTSWDFSDRMDRIEKISSRLPGAML